MVELEKRIDELLRKFEALENKVSEVEEELLNRDTKYKFETDNSDEAEVMMNGWKYKHAFEDVWQQCFRPMFKHNYQNEELAELLRNNVDVVRAIELVSEIYQEIGNELSEH